MLNALIIDDVDYIRKSLARLLESNKFECDVCANGKDAMEMVVAKKYDLIITDIMMPEADGYEFMEFLRAQPDPLCRTPVLAISGGDKTINSDVALTIMKKQADGVLQKPFGKDDLMKAIAKVLGNTRYNKTINGGPTDV